MRSPVGLCTQRIGFDDFELVEVPCSLNPDRVVSIERTIVVRRSGDDPIAILTATASVDWIRSEVRWSADSHAVLKVTMHPLTEYVSAEPTPLTIQSSEKRLPQKSNGH